MSWILYLAIALVCVFFCYLSLRLTLAFQYQMKALEDIGLYARWDLENDDPWLWRYTYFERATLAQMTWQFWRSFSSFYPDQSFRQPTRETAGDKPGFDLLPINEN